MPAVEKQRTSAADSAPIPRPPNSWILYRSDMVAILAPPPPGTSRSQADVSRIISTMWKTEKPEVKAEYERRAEVKKLEHAALYPNYRYMPKSKEIKEELKKVKEDKRKTRKKRNSAQGTAEGSRSRVGRELPFTSHAYPFLPADSAQYLQGGPSPPMSAADSPSPEPSQFLPQPTSAPNNYERVNEQDAPSQGAKSYYRPHTAAPQAAVQYPVAQESTYLVAPHPTVSSHYRTTPTDSPTLQNDLYFPQQFMQPPAIQLGEIQEQQYPVVANASEASTPQESNDDYLSFGIQPFASDGLEQWALENPEFHPTLDQFLTNTGRDCFQLQINPVAQGNLDQQAVGPLEVEVGQMDFDFSQLQWDPTMGTFQSLFENTIPENNGFENMAGPSSQPSPSESSALPSATVEQGFQLDQYINFNPTFDYAVPPPVEEEVVEAPVHTPYVPPAGAVHAGKRRVAGSWNASFAMQDLIDV